MDESLDKDDVVHLTSSFRLMRCLQFVLFVVVINEMFMPSILRAHTWMLCASYGKKIDCVRLDSAQIVQAVCKC